ncbi:Fusaric acid resistance protein family protein [Streptomyces sp. YIM 130001]|uniref:FUSC family protein n=1 Tax=Streptomyces sp. YIM 130001 TaxID=2259644 RepID=UPI000E65B158|nr:FUSC family protein [Streptomyces sp. YIM 130001]RII20975.1 Fusaric acid resistance protein family protein [Streptomyces sp. YIM 130001]
MPTLPTPALRRGRKTNPKTRRHSSPRPRALPLPVREAVRLNGFGDGWRQRGFSGGAAFLISGLVLLAVDRMDLVLYTSAGSMLSLYGHGLPYRARARTLLRLVLGMTAGLAVALVCAATVESVALLVLGAALLAAVHKVACEATRIGPPNNVVITFLTTTAFFLPQEPHEIPFHLSLQLAGGALAWLVAMAPAVVRPHGPERIAVARALEAAARGLRGAGSAHATAAAVNSAWQTLFQVPHRTRSAGRPRARLERLLLLAEGALAENGGTREARAAWFTSLARTLRSGRPLPEVELDAGQHDELDGVIAERAARDSEHGTPRLPGGERVRGLRGVLRQLGPGATLWPVGARTALGCALAGWASMLLGVGHPYWAVVTAAAVFQANTTLSWNRVVQRSLGNLLGVLLFTALQPVIGTGPLVMVLLVVLFQIGAEALITRNYWLGTVCVTPMALILSLFGAHASTGELVADRWIDTVVGVVVGLLACVLVTNRRAAGRVATALAAVDLEAERARVLLEGGGAQPERARSRDRLGVALIELREAHDIAAGEWWQPALPEREIALAERAGHRLLAALVGSLSPHEPPGAAGPALRTAPPPGRMGRSSREPRDAEAS